MKERELYKMCSGIHVIYTYIFEYVLPTNVLGVLPAANTFSSKVSVPVDPFIEN